jgi:hypothetical protein
MRKRPENPVTIAARHAGRAVAALGRPYLLYEFLAQIAARLAPPGKVRRRLARRFQCGAAMVPDVLVHYAAIYTLLALIILLFLRGLFLLCFG